MKMTALIFTIQPLILASLPRSPADPLAITLIKRPLKCVGSRDPAQLVHHGPIDASVRPLAWRSNNRLTLFVLSRPLLGASGRSKSFLVVTAHPRMLPYGRNFLTHHRLDQSPWSSHAGNPTERSRPWDRRQRFSRWEVLRLTLGIWGREAPGSYSELYKLHRR